MLYVLLVLVVVLALISGAEYAMLRFMRATHKAEVMALKHLNVSLERKADRLSKIINVKEGWVND